MKNIVFSGIKPTSTPHLGNYIGALRQWKHVQETHQCYFCIVDAHAITIPQDPEELHERTRLLAATYLAVGIDPKKSALFVQSDVSAHMELCWLLTTLVKMGELGRMTQFKDLSRKGDPDATGAGLFTYPVLMAADILLYDTTHVPVGEDQLQHLELARVLARRFNQRFGETFKIPNPLVQKTGARIMSLADPDKKMSKSDKSTIGTVFLNDTDETIRKKIMKAVTDSGEGILYDPDHRPALANLMVIYQHLTDTALPVIEKTFSGKGYGDFKRVLAEAAISTISPIRSRLEKLLADAPSLNLVLQNGAETANKQAEQKIRLAKKRMGLGY